MGSTGGVEMRIGWEDLEQKEFLKAIKQPLMVQTPLQLVMENLFSRVQSQATFIQQLKEKVDRAAVKDVQIDELLDRIRLLEASQADGATAGVARPDPFNQKEILARMEELEAKVAAVSAERQPAAGAGEQHEALSTSGAGGGGVLELEARLSSLEHRLSGSYNINGKLLAVEQIATGMGIPIPDLEYPTGGQPDHVHPAAPPLAIHHQQMLANLSEHGTPVHEHYQAHGTQHPQPQPQPGEASDRGKEFLAALSTSAMHPGAGAGGGGGPSASQSHGSTNRAPSPSYAAAGPNETGAGPSLGSRSVSPFHSPRGHAASGASAIYGGAQSRFAGGGGGSVPMSPAHVPPIGAGAAASAQRMVQLGQEVAGLRIENETMREGLEQLRQQVASLRTGLGSNATESLSRLQGVEEAVAALQRAVSEHGGGAARSVGGGGAGAAGATAAPSGHSDVSFADFSLLQSQVQAALDEARGHSAAVSTLREKELPALASRVEELAEGVCKAGEPRDMDTLFHERINHLEFALGDVRTELAGTLEAALTEVPKAEDFAALQEQLEAKAPVEAVRLLQQQAATLGTAVAGMADSLALKPDVGEALRAAANFSTGPVASKFRCLTCDQPIHHPPSAKGSDAARVAKGSFLPRLDSMPGKDTPPLAPGVATAEHRSAKEERLLGAGGVNASVMVSGSGAGRGVKAGELEEYMLGVSGGGGGGGGHEAGKAMERARLARTPVGGPAIGKAAAPHYKTPVFL